MSEWDVVSISLVIGGLMLCAWGWLARKRSPSGETMAKVLTGAADVFFGIGAEVFKRFV
jgi:hypothetical protein